MIDKRGNGKTVLVSGCSRGIGRAIAVRFGKEGYHVIANDLQSQADALNELKSEIESNSGKCTTVFADVSDEDSVSDMVGLSIGTTGKIDVLINNAGILMSNMIEDISSSEWDRTFSVNAKGTFLVSKALLPHFRENGWGRIINIASIGGKKGAPGEAHYCASKAAVIEFTKVLAMEAASAGITVNSVCPGVVDTEMGRHNFPDEPSRRKMHDITAIGRIGRPEDIVGAVSFFASDDAAFITGQSLNVCGGIQFD